MELKKPLLSVFRLAVAALILFSAALSSAAQDRDNPSGCSLRTLEGTYGGLVQGTVIVNPVPFPLTPPYLFLLTNLATFDGKGNVSVKYREVFGGIVFPVPPSPWVLNTGTYNVNPDCTVSIEFPLIGGTSHRIGVIAGEGLKQEVHIIYEDGWLVASITLKKAPVGSCSLASLQGSYALFGNGTTPPMITPPLITQVGVLTFDGAGNFSGHDTANINGTTTPDASFTGTYTVNPDCTASATIHSVVGDIHEEGVITGAGEFREFRGIITDAGWAFAQTLTKQ